MKKHVLFTMLFALFTLTAFSQVAPPTYGTFSYQGQGTTCVPAFELCLGACHTTAAGTCNDINTICEQTCVTDGYNGSSAWVDIRPKLVGRKLCYLAVQIKNLSSGCNNTIVLYDPANGIDIQPSPTTYYNIACTMCPDAPVVNYKFYYLNISGQPYFYLIP